MNRFMRLLTHPLTRVAITGLCLFLLFRSVRSEKVVEHLLAASPFWLVVATAFTGMAVACSIFIWGMLLRVCGHKLPWTKLALFYLQGIFFAHVVPGSVGGDAFRTVMTAEITGEGPALASLAASRLAEGMGIMTAAIVATIMLHSHLGAAGTIGALVMAAALVATWVIVFQVSKIASRLPTTGPRWMMRVTDLVNHFAQSFESYNKNKWSLVLAYVVSLISWGINLCALTALGYAVGVDVSWAVFAVCIPVSAATAIAPFAVNGMGLREGVLVGLITSMGVHSSQAFALALLVDFQFLAFVLIGAVCWLMQRSAQRSQ